MLNSRLVGAGGPYSDFFFGTRTHFCLLGCQILPCRFLDH